jgi:hypothetical protein
VHFEKILNEATSEYLVLFHDDDIMLPNYVSTLLPYIEANPLISAVGCNAEIIDKDGNPVGKFFLKDVNMPLVISKSNQFIFPYLVGNIKSTGIVPFPSYMYRRKYISNSFLNYKQGGKYSDVTFLLKILKKASMTWYPEPLMYYRSHGANDSAIDSIPDKLSLIRYLITQEALDRKSLEVVCFKFSYWLGWWNKRHKYSCFFIPNGWREKVIFRFLFLTGIKLLLSDAVFRKTFLQKVAKLIKR